MSRMGYGLKFAGAGLATLLLLQGCAALHPPAAHPVTLRKAAPVMHVEAPGAQGSWPAAAWWQRYGDATLDALVSRALESAPDIAAADARFAAARQSVGVAGAALGVQVEATGDVSRQRLSDNGLISPESLGFNWYNQADLGIQARYSFDWWGKQKAGIAAAVDEAHAVDAERAAVRLELAAAVADAYFGWQSDQQRLVLVRDRLDIAERLSHVTQLRVAAQLDNADMLRGIAAGEAMLREQIAGLEGSARLRTVVLAALLGRGAADLPPLQPQPLQQVQGALPPDVDLDLMARRPDIVASRWRVESAQQGLAAVRAEYYPDISLSALAGLSSVDIGKLLQGGSAVPTIGAAIHLPLFDAGLRKARYGVRQAQVDAAVASYDATVVAAARDVATTATNRLTLVAQREQRDRQLAESRAFADSAAARVKAGTADIRPQLAASLSVNMGLEALVQLDLAALSADIALQRALGGGYLATEKQP